MGQMDAIQAKLLQSALATLGEREVNGSKRNPVIGAWIDRWFRKGADDITAWCGIWMAERVNECSLPVPELPFRAKSWESWGRALEDYEEPQPGDVVVMTRSGGFHVTMLLRTTSTTVWCIGGNQSNAVTVTAYPRERVKAIRRAVP